MRREQCITPRCANRTERKGSVLCSSCRKRDYRQRNPLKASYQDLRQNARRRGKHFDLSFEDFAELAVKTDYINKRGRRSESYTIDRIIPELGYTRDNIMVITNRGNVKKQMYIDGQWNPQMRRMEWMSIIRTELKEYIPDENCPF